MKILIAEDEKDIRNLVRHGLEHEGHEVMAAKDGQEALELFRENEFDLAVLDVMMPRLDGFNLLRKIREKSTLPVIFLTARTDDMDKVLGLGIGADDYVEKPFSTAELNARVNALLRRNTEYSSPGKKTTPTITNGNLTLDLDGCCLEKNGTNVELNAKEYLLLVFLMKNPGRVFTKRQLYSEVWGEDIYTDDNTIMVHISHLRNKIENDPRNPEYIKTIRGIGYKFQPENKA